MQKYFMLTRGRTGSTAILDEMGGIEGVFSVQELFLRRQEGPMRPDLLRDYYRHVLPFDVWRRAPENRLFMAYWRVVMRFKKTKATVAVWLAFQLLRLGLRRAGAERGPIEEDGLYKKYLRYFEKAARRSGARHLIFKVLSHNLLERPGLARALKSRGYRGIYLVRSNVVRQVLSGIIAKKRGAYNRKNYAGDGASYPVDLDEFEMLVNVERTRVEEDRKLLQDMVFDWIEIRYEEFCEHREQFYAGVLAFMGLPSSLPKRTDFSIMIDDPRKLVTNYDELASQVVRMGLGGALDDNSPRVPSVSKSA